MNDGKTAPPGYVLPSRPRWQGGWNVRALLGAVVAFVLTASAATQWLAAQLNNPVEMGDPDTQEIHYLLHAGAEPVLLFAPSRSGKGVSAIIPTLCQWRQSAFVYDLKGENWDRTAGFRHAIGQRVLKFAPTLPFESCCYNPLSEIRWETDYEVADAQTIANAVILIIEYVLAEPHSQALAITNNSVHPYSLPGGGVLPPSGP
jgi:Type IV secretory system Conjugative DNA transfer